MYKAILVAIYKDGVDKAQESLDELAFLTQTLDISIVGKVIQKKQEPSSSYYIGKGKVDEVLDLKDETQARYADFIQ